MLKRADHNQPEIMAALRQAGVVVFDLHEVGHGCPDLLCCFREKTHLLEVKSAHGKLTSREAAWHAAWPGKVHIVHNVDEALAALGLVNSVSDLERER